MCDSFLLCMCCTFLDWKFLTFNDIFLFPWMLKYTKGRRICGSAERLRVWAKSLGRREKYKRALEEIIQGACRVWASVRPRKGRNLVKEMGREIYRDTGEEWKDLFSGESERLFSRIEVKIGRCPCGCLWTERWGEYWGLREKSYLIYWGQDSYRMMGFRVCAVMISSEEDEVGRTFINSDGDGEIL